MKKIYVKASVFDNDKYDVVSNADDAVAEMIKYLHEFENEFPDTPNARTLYNALIYFKQDIDDAYDSLEEY